MTNARIHFRSSLILAASVLRQGGFTDRQGQDRRPGATLQCRITLDKEKYEVGEPIVVNTADTR